MLKKRVLVPLVGQGSIIHIVRTGMLEKMRSFCEPVVLLLWQQNDLMAELKQAGIEVHLIPGYTVSDTYKHVRQKINFWYQYFKLKTTSTDIQKKYQAQFRPAKLVFKQRLKEKLLWFKLRFNPFYIRGLIKAEKQLLPEEAAYKEYSSWLKQLNAAGIFTVTPFLQEVELIARILKEGDGQLIASIHSFDNVTKRGWPAIFFDNYFVWNKYNKAELERINPAFIKQANINITGAPQFDFHYNKAFCWDKDDWLQHLGVPKGKRIILYAGGSAHLFPNEPQYVKHIVDGFEKKLLPGDTVILFRCHPLDSIQRWKDYIGNSPFLYYDHKAPGQKKLDYNNFTDDDERRLVSTLKHTDVHINLCSTMTVDGSIFNKPQIAPCYDDVVKTAEPFLKAQYRQEHYQPIVKSGVLNYADSREKLISLINGALTNPTAYNANCLDCVNEIATYNDGKSTERVITKMKTFL